MKRRIASDISFGSSALKRRSSSLFSIDTITTTDSPPSRPPSELNLSSKLDLEKVCTPPHEDATETEVSSSASDGFFIDESDDDDDDTDHLKLIPSIHVKMNSINEAKSIPPIHVKTDSIAIEAKSIQPLRTGIVFEAGTRHYDRANRLHKERPVRVTSIMDALERSSIHNKLTILQENDMDPLEDDDYLQVHLPGYMKRLDKLSNCNCCDKLDREAQQFKSIYFTKDSVTEAKTAATSLCRLVTMVVEGNLDNGFAVIRPPGHHAEPGVAGGYCVINNVAVAASYAREKLGLAKVLIVDWDVHHGNGTQAIFLNDPNVLYFSVHRWHGGNYFPFLQNSGPSNVGIGDGEGFNVNVGWSRKGMGDDEYLAVWEKLLLPIARGFQPDLVLVSAGFDAALGDMGECNVTSECFGRLTRSLMTLANGKVVCALEGGYVRSVLAKCVESVVTSLLDSTSPQVSESETKEVVDARAGVDVLDIIDKSAAKSILATIAAHESYWPCLGK